jgi:hypothetical protein
VSFSEPKKRCGLDECNTWRIEQLH